MDRFLFPKKLIEEGCTKKLINFNLADVTGDQRLLELLPAKTNDFYPFSEFYRDFTNFQVNEKDFSKTLGFEDTSYRFSENKISDILRIHIIQSNKAGTQRFFNFLPVFMFVKERGVSEIFRDIFYSYLTQNETEVFTTEEEFSNRYKKNVRYIVNDQGQFKFLGKDIEDPDLYGVYHLEELEESKIFSQTYILYEISGVLKQTFVSELEKFTNIYSQFTIFCKKNDQNFKSFTIDNKKKFSS